MKNGLKYLSVALGALVLSLGFQLLGIHKTNTRVHQHRTMKEIPIIEIQTNNQKILGASYYGKDIDGNIVSVHEPSDNVVIDFKYTDENGNEINTDALIHVRGNSSRWFAKSSYMVHLVDEEQNPVDKNLAGMGSYNEWILNGPFLDKTLLRNYLCMNISGEIMEYAPEVAYVNLYIDDEYQGLYLLMESIARDDDRIQIKKADSHDYVTSYIVNQDRDLGKDIVVDTFSNYTYKTGVSVFCLNYPGVNTYTEQKLKFVREDLSQIEKKIYSYDLKTRENDYINDIDLQSFADYFIINEFFGNLDSGFYSTYFYKDVRGKLKTCVWDFNNACDNYMEHEEGFDGFHMHNAPWFEQLVKDDRFVELVINTYRQLRKNVLSEEYLQNYISETIEWLGDNVDKNYSVWGDTFNPQNYSHYDKSAYFLSPIERNPKNYDEAVDQLRTYITNRGQWLDMYIDTLKQYCHESRIGNELLQ